MVSNHKGTTKFTAPVWKEFEKSEVNMTRLNVLIIHQVLTIKEKGNLRTKMKPGMPSHQPLLNHCSSVQQSKPF